MTEQLFNIILTAIFGLFASIAYYKYIKRENREMNLEKDKKDALAALVDAKHNTLLEKFDDTKTTIIQKIDDHVSEQKVWQASVDNRFYQHAHRIDGDIADDIIIRKK